MCPGLSGLEQQHFTDAGRLAESARAMTSLGYPMRSALPAWVLGVVALARGDQDTAADQFPGCTMRRSPCGTALATTWASPNRSLGLRPSSQAPIGLRRVPWLAPLSGC